MTSINDFKMGPFSQVKDKIIQYLNEKNLKVESMQILEEELILIECEYVQNQKPAQILLGFRQITVADLDNFSKEKNKEKKIISTTSITNKALQIMQEKSITQIDEENTPSKTNNILEKVFETVKTEEEVREFFKKKRGLFGLFSTKEIGEIKKGYTPVAAYKVKREFNEIENIKNLKINEWENRFYVNLNNLELYYVNKNTRNKSGQVKSTNTLHKILELPDDCIHFITPLIEYGELSKKTLTDQEMQILKENLNLMTIIINKGLARLKVDETGFVSHMKMPEITGERYNLEKYIPIKESVSTTSKIDPINWHPQDINHFLSNLFYAQSEFQKIIYLPYHQCKYYLGNGKVEYKRLINAKIIGGK